MNCPRCDGLMVPEECCDIRDEYGQFCFEALRCLLCGEIMDHVILANRQSRPEPKVAHKAWLYGTEQAGVKLAPLIERRKRSRGASA